MPQRPDLLIRRLGRRFGVVLAVVAGLLLVDQAVLQPLLVQLNLSAPVINLAGRQRMLSQSIAKDALALSLESGPAPARAAVLDERLAEWRRVHEGLKGGDRSLALTAAGDPEIRRRLLELDPAVAAMTSAVEAIQSGPTTSSEEVRRLLEAEEAFLPAMNEVVQLYEQDAQRQVQRLRTTALVATAAVITLMAGLYWLVLAPAVGLIRQQVVRLEEHERELIDARDLLEQRVEDRTRQLSESNLALENEARRRAESEQRTLLLQSQLAQASRLNSLGELATGIAHELNQPLGAVSNYAETLLILADQTPLDRPALARTATRVRESAQRAGTIIRRMRNFIRSRNGPRTAEPVNALIKDVVALCEPDLRSHSVEVRLECVGTASSVALVDPIQIQQVLVNLVRNAAQAVETRPVGERRVTITTSEHDGDVEIQVTDNGAGFPDQFDVCAVGLRSTKPDGLGLGLSISRSIVEAHGGKLLATNGPDGGACVTVLLPVHPLPDHELAACLVSSDRLCR